jgi:microcystin-dependent protein
MTFWKWSRTASLNASADASINWAEGQPPSSVNDSARAMMAAAAKYRDDISGAIATGGTSTAYTVMSWQVFDTPAHLDGQMIAFTPHTTNGATVTLNVDSTGAKPLRSAPNVELPSGALIQGTPYVCTYNSSDGAFYLQGGASNPYNVPLGGMLPYIGSSAPNSAFVLPYGQAISRTTYATLFSLVGTTFGSGDGSTTFNVPDLRGRVFAGLDNMGGSSASRLSSVFTSTVMGSTGGAQNQAIAQANIPNYNLNITNFNDPGHRHTSVAADQGYPTTNAYSGTGASAGSVAFFSPASSGAVNLQTTATSLQTTGISFQVNSGGAGTALTTTQPTIVVNFILRII